MNFGYLWLLIALSGAASADEIDAMLEAGRVDQALAASTAAVGGTSALSVRERHVDLLLGVGQADDAAAFARDAIAANPNDPDAHYLLGRALPDPINARRAYEAALRINPEHARAYMGVAAVHYAQGQLPRALDAFREATERDASLEEAWLGLVRTYVGLGQRTEAAKAARAGLVAVPDEVSLALALADLDPREALPVLQRAVASHPDDPRVLGVLASTLIDAGDAPAGLAHAEAALRLAPGLPSATRALMVGRELGDGALTNAGWSSIRQAQGATPAEALKLIDGVVQRHPRSAVARFHRGRLHQQQSRTAESLTDLAKAAELAPNDLEIVAAFGLAAHQAGDHAAAVAALTPVFSSRPEDLTLGLAFTESLARSGHLADALKLGSVLHHRNPGDARAAITHADALLVAGRSDDAWKVLMTSLRLAPDERVLLALIPTAITAGRTTETAALLEQIGAAKSDRRWSEAAHKLRERGR